MCIDYRDLHKIVQQNVFSEHGLKIKWKKCKFLQPEVVCRIKNGCISPDDKKCAAIQNYPTPDNLKKLQSFLGLTGYFRKFVQTAKLFKKNR